MKLRIKNRKLFMKYVWGFIALIVVATSLVIVLKLPKREKTDKPVGSELPTEVAVTANVKGENLSEKGAEDTIKAYFEAYYKSLGTQTPSDMSALYETTDPEGEKSLCIDNAAIEYLIAYRKLYPGLVAFTKVDYTMKYFDDTVSEDGTLTVGLYLDEACEFIHTAGNTSYMTNVKHTFTLRRTGDAYKIITHTSDGISDTLTSAYSETLDTERTYTADETAALIKEAKDKMIDRANTNVVSYYEELAAYNAAPSSFAYTAATNAYDRTKAVDYANTWVGENSVLRNTSVWVAYDTFGGNCTNYASQCLYAGGMPMDLSGDYIWKWYSDTPDTTGAATGRCPSWTAVNSFYNYCMNNTGYGLSATVGGNFYSGQPGDFIVMGTGKDYSHIVIIVDVVKDADGKVIDYLIDSNTSDRKNYPLAAYGHNNMRLIHINGWNNQ